MECAFHVLVESIGEVSLDIFNLTQHLNHMLVPRGRITAPLGMLTGYVVFTGAVSKQLPEICRMLLCTFAGGGAFILPLPKF